MSNSNNPTKQGNYDIFIANSIYPDAAGLLGFQLQSLSSIKEDCLIVVDTNVLLLPYNVGKEDLIKIGELYSKLVKTNQFFVPGQVIREFANNRAKKLTELFQQISRKSNISIPQFGKNYPLLKSVEEYEKMINLEREIDEKLSDYRKAISNLKRYIKSWTWNDPVSVLYSELFQDGVIFDPEIQKQEVLKDLEYRQTHKIPPGYKDSSKDDDGVGDLLIWHTILELGQKYKKSVLFVTGEEKPDWYHKSENQGLYPRFELVDEFRRKSEGQSFHIISFSGLLELFGASSELVEEIHSKEAFSKRQQKYFLNREADIAERLVYQWLLQTYPNAEIDSSRFSVNQYSRIERIDFIIIDEEVGWIGVEVKYFQQNIKASMARLANILEQFHTLRINNHRFDRLILFLVTTNSINGQYL